ncbi:uncharacterized protein LOC121732587 [Aricia agestis]|uniref:uncharacterized protein LOC121732587 n=1 Tax=Aricia agestis TaxID=91739 RepID=UPI001C202825|nr:uncharacterized protein LOC121732587 [Aricia agestis]
MFVAAVVFFVATVAAQDQSLSAQTHPPLPFMDLFTGASNLYSNLYSNPIRKTYSDPEYHGSCQKTDTLTSFANFLTSAAKVMLSAAVIILLKLLGGKFLLLPIAVMVFVKMGLKALLLWPVITKMIKHFKKKKKRNNNSRTIRDCSERLACLIQRSSHSFGSNIGAAVTFSLIDDVDDDHFVAKTLLSILAGDKVAQCMSLDCTSGPDVS